MADVEAHTLLLHVAVPEWVPTHAERDEASPEFRHARETLIADGHTTCWGCALAGRRVPAAEAHHFGAEWCEWNAADPDRVLAFLESIDPYGYAAKMKGQPLTGPDDIRNLLMLCVGCHRGAPRQPADRAAEPGGYEGGGLHYQPFPTWLAERFRASAP